MNAEEFRLAGASSADRISDRVRSIPLGDLLTWHGFKLKREGVSFRAKDDRYNIVINGEKWFDNRAGVGGAGAIDLQMHLCGGDFRATCRVLAEQFRPEVGGLAFPDSRVRKSFPIRRSFEELASQYALANEGNWSIARDYLVNARGLDPDLIDPLHDRGLIYANNHRPNPSLVFIHRTIEGKVEGATLRDTRHESTFRPCLGNKTSAWFSVGDPLNATQIVAVESPIDAVSYYQLKPSNQIAIVSCAGCHIPDELLNQVYTRRQSLMVALDNDSAGETGWRAAWDQTADWAGFKISSDCPKRKDWNADLLADQPAVKNRRELLSHV
ncbi:MAG: toprim domain-containing protein [Chthoniobacterales bacterium]|nr:toprim domain-containing protein [Chthoniobacterales bacterium]